MNLLKRINRLPRGRRWLAKCLFVGAVYLGVTYPRLDLLPRHFSHLLDLPALTDPTNPALQPLLLEARQELREENISDPVLVLAHVERKVLEVVPYAWDWDTWGVMDYLPSVEETLGKGREDCDGRAVVACALLRGLGYDAHLTSDVQHVWVWTPYGETMSPGGPQIFRQTADGKQRFNFPVLYTLPASLGYGMAVFPLWRQLVVTLAVWLAVLHPDARPLRLAVGLALLVQGLVMVRLAAWNPYQMVHWGIWLAFGHLALGIVLAGRKPRIREGPGFVGRAVL
jgi:hypothetical protein